MTRLTAAELQAIIDAAFASDDPEPGGPFTVDHEVLDSTGSVTVRDRDGGLVGSVVCEDCHTRPGHAAPVLSPLERIAAGD